MILVVRRRGRVFVTVPASRALSFLCEAMHVHRHGCQLPPRCVIFFSGANCAESPKMAGDRAVHCVGGRPGRGAAWQARTSCWTQGRASARPAPWDPSWPSSKRSPRCAAACCPSIVASPRWECKCMAQNRGVIRRLDQRTVRTCLGLIRKAKSALLWHLLAQVI